MFKFISLFSFLLICSYTNFSHAKEMQFSWDENHVIQVKIKESKFAAFLSNITITMTNTNTDKSVIFFQDDTIPLEFIVKKIGTQQFFFYSTHSGGESGGYITLRYLTLDKNGEVLNRVLEETPANFEFVDVDKDGKEEIVTQDMRFEWFELKTDCEIIGFYAQYFDTPAYFFPKIISYQNHSFINNTFKFKSYLQKHYLSSIEKMLLEENEEKNYLAGFIQYFYVSAKLGLRNQALSFIKKHNKPYTDCQGINSTVFDLIQNNKERILKTLK